MKNSNNYKIHTTQQLIDINSNLKKFSAEINITSKNEDDEFDILVVTQTELDNIDFEQNYKRIKHKITINVDSDDGNTDNYVLVIKSEKETDVNITIDLKDLDSKSVDTPPQAPPVVENNPQQNVRKNNGEGFVTKVINFLRKYFFIIILLILLACFVYIYFIKKTKKIPPNDTYIADTNLNTELLNKIDSTSNSETPQLQTTLETPQLDTSVAQPVVQPAPLQTSVAQPAPLQTSVAQPAPLQTSVAQPAPQPVVQPAPQPVVQPAPQPVVQPAPLQTSITQSPQLETNLVQSHSSSVSDSVRDMSNSSGVSNNRDSILERLRNIRKN